MLTTERLILRKWEEADAEDLYNIAKNEKVALPCGWMPHESVEKSLMLIQTVLRSDDIYAICLKETGKVIGSTGLKVGSDSSEFCIDSSEAEVGYWIGEEYWRQGFTTEAIIELMRFGFEEMGLSKLWCNHFEGNKASNGVKEKLGFKHINIINDHKAERINKVVDLYVGCITLEEWKLKYKK